MEIRRPRGTRDFLFKKMNKRKYVENTLKRVFETYGYSEIKTPIFEDLSLFTIKSGDEIKKQIYHFKDKGGRDLALRPELTAPVARLYIHKLQKKPKPIKMYYSGSCFRYERPQAGRWRQFWQFGCELIGGKSPEAEAEVITLSAHCLWELGLRDFEIHVGNLGILRGILKEAGVDGETQDHVMSIIDKGDVEELEVFLESLSIDEASHQILLLLIGMKGSRSLIEKVRRIIEGRDEALESLRDLERLLDTLEVFGLSDYVVNLGIARGLDYYSGMVFEIYVHGLGAQKQICGGGTYNLIEAFGGEHVESTGFAFGFDRVMAALEKQNIKIPIKNPVDVFVAPISNDTREEAFKIAQNLRKNSIPTDVDLSRKKLKKILSYADNLETKYVVLVGKRDLEQGKVTLKDMGSGEQELVHVDEIVQKLQEVLK